MPTKSNNTGGRGGARPGAGRKKSTVKDKAKNGNPGGRKLEVLDIPEVEGVKMPKPRDFLSAEQRPAGAGNLHGNLAMAQRHRLCRKGVAAAFGALRHVFRPLGAV